MDLLLVLGATVFVVGGGYAFTELTDPDRKLFKKYAKKRVDDVKQAMSEMVNESYIFKEDKRNQVVYQSNEYNVRIVVEEKDKNSDALKVVITRGSNKIVMSIVNDVVIYEHDETKLLKELRKDKKNPNDFVNWMLSVKKKWELREIKTEEEHNTYEEMQIKVRNIMVQFEKEKEVREISNTPVFGDVLKEMYLLRKEKEYLTEEEYHKINKTYPHDLNELKMMYFGLNDQEKEEVRSKVEDSLSAVRKEINQMKRNVRDRKLGQVETKVEVIKVRSEI